jgi:ribosomal protein S18 acetylase RimI-like enzyme
MIAIQIRRVEALDDKTTAGLARLIPQVSSSAPAVVDSLVRSLLETRTTSIFVAERDGEIVGTASLIVVDSLSGRKGHIEDVAVDESVRRARIGTALMDALVAHARQLGLRHIDLTSRPSRKAANAFYQSFGFQRRDTNVYRYDLEHGSAT